jgi:N-succinyldiaminopimelate aminotransferase
MRELMASRVKPYRASIFEEMSTVARKYGAVDLGTGTPTMAMPDMAAKAAFEAMEAGRNQYSQVAGDIALRSAVASHSARFYGQHIDATAEVSITCGVTEGIHSAMLALIDPGDEVVVLEPCYDSYAPSIRFAGGVPVPVTLRSPAFHLDAHELAAAFSQRTKALIVNNPHNPTGKVFTHPELEEIAALCRRFDVLAISDEVYEHIVFDGRNHIRLATLPGMRERTLTLSGASKTFSCTGWRIGWAIGPEPLHAALSNGRQFGVFCAPTPLQLAVARCLDLKSNYFIDLAREFQARRDILLGALERSAFPALQPASGFFALAPFPLGQFRDARDCCYALARDFGVVPIPLDTFYINPNHAEPLIRFTFCHGRETLIEAGKRLSSTKVHAECHQPI